VPLALYLLSFILVFLRYPVVWTGQSHTNMAVLQPIAILCLVFILVLHQASPIYRSMAISIIAFFVTALVCHGELARDRPGTRHLTEFYLWLSVGGMLGGMFNALLAPMLFQTGALEFPLAIILACLIRPNIASLVPMEKPVSLLMGVFAGFVVGVLLSVTLGILGILLGILVGAVLGALYQPSRQRDGWTERALTSLFPAMAASLQKMGEDLAQGSPPAEGAEPARPRARRTVTNPYYLLSYGLDVFLPLVLGIFVYWIISSASSDRWGWTVIYRRLDMPELVVRNVKENSLFAFWYQTVGVGNGPAAAFWTRNSSQVLMYWLPLAFCLLYSHRPLRFGLGVAAFLLATNLVETSGEERVLFRGRTYFGILRVLKEDRPGAGGSPLVSESEASAINQSNIVKTEAGARTWYTYLMHGTTYHGQNYQEPDGLRRLATTYYHRKGPVGVIMEHFNWFPGPQDTYWADARMPASMVAYGPDAWSQLVNTFSEPPYATIGLGSGTMASYARPFHHMAYYEIDDQIKEFHLPGSRNKNYYEYVQEQLKDRGGFVPEVLYDITPKQFLQDQLKDHPGFVLKRIEMPPFFNYVHDALFRRGAGVEIIMGDARQSLAREPDQGTGWYHERNGYYHAMVVDAFSSDAIPVHLITEEAIKLYFSKLSEHGVLMVHTSNRHVDLVSPVSDIAVRLNLAYRVGKDQGGEVSGDRGLFASEYVMLARDEKDLPRETPPEDIGRVHLTWSTPQAPHRRVWTDDYTNMISVFRWGFGYGE
jgi:hypothetical protein